MNPSDGSWVRRFLVLVTLTGFSVAQPIYDLIGRTPEFLLVHDARPLDLLLVMAVLTLAVPLGLSLVEQLCGLVGPSWRRGAHRVNVGLLSSLFFLLLAKRWLDSNSLGAIATAVVLASLLVVAYERSENVGLLLRILSPAALLFPLLFGARAGVRELLWPMASEVVVVGPIAGETPVVFVVFDGLPVVSLLGSDGAVDAIRYPNFAALAATSTWFSKATTVADGTVRALPAILAGVRPVEKGLPYHHAYPVNLFTMLGPSYELNVVERLTKLCPEELCGSAKNPAAERRSLLATDLLVVYLHLIAPEEMRARLPSIETNWRGFRKKERDEDNGESPRPSRVSLFTDFVDGIESSPRRSLHFIHSLVPHAPHRHLPSGRRYTRTSVEPSGEDSPWGQWVDDEWAVLHSQQRHLLQVQLADNLLGMLLDRLDGKGLFDDSIVVVTSDHGASFYPGVAHRGLSEGNLADIMAVPLFVKRPGQHQAVVDRRPVETIDIVPTVAELLGVELPRNLDGHSLLDATWPGRDSKLVSGKESVLTVDSADLDTRASLERMIEVFGSGGTHGVFPRVEAFPELLGRRPRDLVGESRGYRVAIENQRRLARVRPRSGFVPAQISGFLLLPEAREVPICLAVAVNGPIEATTCVYRRAEDPMARKWSVLVPEAVLHPGRNEVSVFVVDEIGENLSLIPTSLE